MKHSEADLEIIKANAPYCIVCRHPQVLQIEQSRLKSQDSLRDIASTYSMAYESVRLHFNNCLPKRKKLSPTISKVISNNQNEKQSILKAKVETINKIVGAKIPGEELIDIQLTPSQYKTLLNYITEQESKKDSRTMIDRATLMLKKLENMMDELTDDEYTVTSLTKIANSAKGFIDVIAKLKGEYQNIMQHPVVIEILHKFINMAATCEKCKPEAQKILHDLNQQNK